MFFVEFTYPGRSGINLARSINVNTVLNYKKNRDWAENLTIVMQLGLTMVGCIGFCFFIGLQIDKWIGTKGIFVTIFTILGIFGGGNVAYRQIMEIFADKTNHQNTDHDVGDR